MTKKQFKLVFQTLENWYTEKKGTKDAGKYEYIVKVSLSNGTRYSFKGFDFLNYNKSEVEAESDMVGCNTNNNTINVIIFFEIASIVSVEIIEKGKE